jgi:hypothetical protein
LPARAIALKSEDEFQSRRPRPKRRLGEQSKRPALLRERAAEKQRKSSTCK